MWRLRPKSSLTVPHTADDWARETFGQNLNVVRCSDEYRHRLERVLVAKLTGITVPGQRPYSSRGWA